MSIYYLFSLNMMKNGLQTRGAIVLGMSFDPWENPVKQPVNT
jgi:hypothetical protein